MFLVLLLYDDALPRIIPGDIVGYICLLWTKRVSTVLQRFQTVC